METKFELNWISAHIINVYECNGTNIFMRWKMKCSIQRGEAELNGIFHLSPNENIYSVARMRKIHYLFYITWFTDWDSLITKFNFEDKFKRKVLKSKFSLSNTLNKPRVQLYAGNITRTLTSHKTHALRLLHLHLHLHLQGKINATNLFLLLNLMTISKRWFFISTLVSYGIL